MNTPRDDLESEVVRLRREVAAHAFERDLFARCQRIAGFGTLRWDFASDAVHWSEGTLRIYGVSEEEFGGDLEDVIARVHPEDRAELVSRLERLRETGEDFELRCRVVRPDGEVRLLIGRGEAERDAEGRICGMLGIVHDVSSSHASAVAYDRQAHRLRAAEESGRIGTWDWRPDEDALHWSERAHRLLGVPESGAPASFAEFLARVHPEDRPRVRQVWERAGRETTNQADYQLEHRTLGEDGAARWLQTTARVERDAEGRTVAVHGTLLDVTDRRELERQLLRAQKMESIGRLAGGIAHNFNNQFTIVLGALAVLEDTVRDPDAEQALIAIHGAIERSGKLTHELLSFGRRQELVVKPLDLGRSLREIETLLKPLLGEHIEVHVRVAEDLWPVEADAARLEQVLVNMALNARDAMPRGGALVFTAANIPEEDLEEGAEGPRVRLVVRDTGCGMDPETVRRVFDPFFTTKAKGAGLGLASAYGMVRQMGGSLDVQSAPDRGTRFAIELRKAEGRVEEPEAGIVRGGHRAMGSGEVVLLVEDEAVLRELLAQSLNESGYLVLMAPNASVATRRLEEYGAEIGLVISDAVMPGLSGLEFLDRVRRAGHGTPTLLMTGYLEREDSGPKAGEVADREMRKPFTPAALLEVVAEMLAAREPRRRVREARPPRSRQRDAFR